MNIAFIPVRTLLCVAALLSVAACSDDDSFMQREDGGSPVKPSGKLPDEVFCYDELKNYECNEATKGARVYLKDQAEDWECFENGSWYSAGTGGEKVPQFNSDITYGTMTDSRDGHEYKTVVIGNQTWMAENLNYDMKKEAYSRCFKKDSSKCEIYGRLYSWEAALSACPEDWHLPSWDEFDTLLTFVGGAPFAGTKLKSASRWEGFGYGTDDFGFSALPAGEVVDMGSTSISTGDYALGEWTYFWSSTALGTKDNVYSLELKYDEVAATKLQVVDPSNDYYSVRCLKD